jgi:hypothetical protein
MINPRSGQAKAYDIVIWCFSDTHAVLRNRIETGCLGIRTMCWVDRNVYSQTVKNTIILVRLWLGRNVGLSWSNTLVVSTLTITPSMQIRIWRNVRVNRLFISKNKSSGFLYVNYFLHLPLSSPTDSISYVRITTPSEAVDTNSVWQCQNNSLFF